MGVLEANTTLIYGVHIRESANDGSDFSNAAADYRILFLGEDGQVHFKDSSGTVTTPAASAGGLVLLTQQTASASATLDLTGFISSTYDEYMIEGVNIRPATDATDLLLRVGTGAGPTYDTGANYDYATSNINASSGAHVINNNAGNTSIIVFKSMDNDAGFGNGSFSLKLTNPQGTSQRRKFHGTGAYANSAPAEYNGYIGGAWTNTTTAMTAVRFLMSSGNITSGTIRIYGIAK